MFSWGRFAKSAREEEDRLQAQLERAESSSKVPSPAELSDRRGCSYVAFTGATLLFGFAIWIFFWDRQFLWASILYFILGVLFLLIGLQYVTGRREKFSNVVRAIILSVWVPIGLWLMAGSLFKLVKVVSIAAGGLGGDGATILLYGFFSQLINFAIGIWLIVFAFKRFRGNMPVKESQNRHDSTGAQDQP